MESPESSGDASADFRAHWDGVYAAKLPDQVSWYQAVPERSLAMIDSLGLGLDGAIVDIGAGASTLVDHLLDRGYRRVTALDIAGAALEHARLRLGDRAALVRWVVADATRGVPGGPFNLWHDRAVFHFLTAPDERRRYVESLVGALAPGGFVVISCFAPDGPARCSGLEVARNDAPGLARELGPGFRLLREQREEHTTPWGATQRFVYALFQRE